MLHINNACIAFGTEVLFSGFNMKLERGETACIVGQSGCGKTSLLNAVMGFVPLKEGSVRVGETLLDRSTIDSVRRQIAWIPQELALPFEWVKEMVALPFGLKVKLPYFLLGAPNTWKGKVVPRPTLTRVASKN